MKLEELRKKSELELKQTLDELAKERFSLRIKRGSGLNPKPNLFRENKISIARVKTILNEIKMESRTKILKAKVLKTAMDKSAVVSVERLVKHPVNGKYIKRSTKYHIHDENNKCTVGEQVRIKQCRPLSKLKTWILVEE